PSWMRELTRDGLNTILGKFPPIKVYSRQKIDFVQEKRHLSQIEAAEDLGMSKMLSAGVSIDENNVTLDLDIVDIRTGLLEATERVVGPPDKLMELENDLAGRAAGAPAVAPSSPAGEARRASPIACSRRRSAARASRTRPRLGPHLRRPAPAGARHPASP